MKLSRIIAAFLLLLCFACSDDDQEINIPQLEIISKSTVKPDSILQMEVTVLAVGLLTNDVINGELLSGEGALTKTGFTGGNMENGSATFDFAAGSTENTKTLIRFTASDLNGQTGTAEIEIDITSLEIKRVAVLNEGNFFSANGSLDVFDISSNQVNQGAFPANATVQQATIYNELIYVVTNAPDRLDVLNEQMESMASIDQGLDNPISFAAVGTKGYISNWGNIATAFTENPDSYIAIVDLQSNEVIDSVLLTDRPQHLISHEEKVYVALEGASSVAVLDPTTLSLSNITVAPGPSDMVVDHLGMIWVLCTSGSLVEIDPNNETVGASIDGLTTSGFNEKLSIDGNGNNIYFLGGSNDSFTGLTTVYRVDLMAQTVDPIIENGQALYGIGVNPESGQIYLGDSNAFQSTGTAFIYDASGNKLSEFATGIGPKGFVFMNN